MTKITEALDQYVRICTEAVSVSGTKLSKSLEKIIIEVLLLYMVIPGKINFTQLGRYGRHGEQCYRQNFGRKRLRERVIKFSRPPRNRPTICCPLT
jgi:hypothetical protein